MPPIAEQERIVEMGSVSDGSLAAARGEVQRLRRLKRGLLQDLLTGRVRVTPD